MDCSRTESRSATLSKKNRPPISPLPLWARSKTPKSVLASIHHTYDLHARFSLSFPPPSFKTVWQ